MAVAYLDSSALVKLVVEEEETAALRAVLSSYPARASSELARVEVLRAMLSRTDEQFRTARVVLGGLLLLPLDQFVLDRAVLLGPPELRVLDAIHLASALSLGEDLEVLVAYDRRLLAAAATAGLPTQAPS